jgi:hypothetical protein
MTRAWDFFVSFIVSDLGMYEEFGMKTRNVVQGSRAVVFWMESKDVM